MKNSIVDPEMKTGCAQVDIGIHNNSVRYFMEFLLPEFSDCTLAGDVPRVASKYPIRKKGRGLSLFDAM